jgi:hypothetical protein
MKMSEKLLIGLVNLALAVLTASLMIGTYHYLISSIYKQKTDIQFKKQKLEYEIESLRQLLSHPKDLTPQEIRNFDIKHETNFSSFTQSLSVAPSSYVANQEILSSKLEQEKIYKEAALSTMEHTSPLSCLPAWPMLIILALGVFFTRLINNFADIVFDFISQGFKKIKDCWIKSSV